MDPRIVHETLDRKRVAGQLLWTTSCHTCQDRQRDAIGVLEKRLLHVANYPFSKSKLNAPEKNRGTQAGDSCEVKWAQKSGICRLVKAKWENCDGS